MSTNQFGIQEAAVMPRTGIEQTMPGSANTFADFDNRRSVGWPVAEPGTEGVRPFGLDVIPAGLTAGVSAPIEPAAGEATSKSWFRRTREWIAGKRDKIAYTVGAAAIFGALQEGEETLGALEVQGTLGGVMKGCMELIANMQVSEHTINTGALSLLGCLAIGTGLAMRKRMPRASRRRAPGEVGLSELTAPRRQDIRDLARADFAATFAAYSGYCEGVITEITHGLDEVRRSIDSPDAHAMATA